MNVLWIDHTGEPIAQGDHLVPTPGDLVHVDTGDGPVRMEVWSVEWHLIMGAAEIVKGLTRVFMYVCFDQSRCIDRRGRPIGGEILTIQCHCTGRDERNVSFWPQRLQPAPLWFRGQGPKIGVSVTESA